MGFTNFGMQSPRREAPEAHHHPHPQTPCPQLPGTLVRVFIPAGAVINLLNLIEIDSPSGVCLIVRSPLLGGTSGTSAMTSLIQQVQQAGGTVEIGG